MSIFTGGTGGGGYQSLGTPSGGGSFYDSSGPDFAIYRTAAPEPGDPSFIGPVQPAAQIAENSGTSFWQDIGKQIAGIGLNYIAEKTLGGVPKNKTGSIPQRIPGNALPATDTGDHNPQKMDMGAAVSKLPAGVLLVGVVAIVLLLVLFLKR